MITNYILLQDPAGSGYSSLIMIVLLIVIFYFFMIRPQSNKQKEIKKFRDGMQKGDKVTTAGGIYGKIRDIKDNIVILEIDDNVKIRIDKGSVYPSIQDVNEAGADVKNK